MSGASRVALLAAVLAATLFASSAEAQFVGGSRYSVAPRQYPAGRTGFSGPTGFSGGYRFSYFTGYRGFSPLGYRRARYGYAYPSYAFAYGYPYYGYPFSYGFRPRRVTPYGMYPRYFPGDPPVAGPITYPAPVYTTVVVPSAEDGRLILVDMIRGGRAYASPTYTAPRPVAPSPPVDPDSLLKPGVTDDTLAGLLEHTNPQVRRKAAEVLLSRGSEGVAALRRVTEPTNSPYLRASAFFVLARAAASALRAELTAEVEVVLREGLHDSSSQVRQAALESLARLPGDPQPETLTLVAAALRDPSQGVREEAIAALAHWREAAIRPLVDALGSQRDQARDAASKALGRMGATAVDPLVSLLDSPRASVRFSAASALGDIGAPAAAARVSLAKLAEGDPDPSVRYYARSALSRIEP